MVLVVLPLLQPPELLVPSPLLGHPVMEVVGVCCLGLEDDLPWPHRFCPISVSVLELELVGSPQLSFEPPAASLVVGVERLQVEELRE